MFLLQSKEILEHVSDIIHADTQEQELHLDLTVAEIHRYAAPASLDFGGSEFEAAKTELIKPEKRNGDDKYGWWELSGGTYRAVLNESLDNPEDIISIISLHDHAQAAGVISSTGEITSKGVTSLSMNFVVPDTGCHIKENARFARLHMLKG